MSADPEHETETTDRISLEDRQVSRVEPRPNAPDHAPLHVQQVPVAAPKQQPQPQNQGKGQQQQKQKGPPQHPQQKHHAAPEVVELVKIREALDVIKKTASEAETSADSAVEAVQELAVWLKKEMEQQAVRQKRLFDGVEAQTKAVQNALSEQRRLMNVLALTPDGKKKLKQVADESGKQAAVVPWWADWKINVAIAVASVVGAGLALWLGGR